MLLTLAKRILLLPVGPAIFLFLAFAPTVCSTRKGFRGWYWRRVSRACSLLLWFLDVKVEISDAAREALRTDENSIIAVNHRSHLDGFTMLHVIPDEKWVTFGAKKELCEAALLKRGFEGAGLLTIDRQKGRDALSSLTGAITEMPARRSPILFVEGTRSTKPGLAPFKAGAVLIAQQTGRAIRPFVISHSDKLLPRGKVFPFKGTVHIDVLDQMSFANDENTDAAVARLRGAMARAYDAQTGETTPEV
ncbi:1-acyl-sn-glycerol-3-phosphate acyltransferase [Shimia sp. R9_2]|uniref:lysophospholipid acyltransferase family protein n=1 Tax=Shimia sp. R9_2 TaxID=2821112 RepID=UPI001ADC2D54|nr:lysophospholipid acyltransferase family protein [Shimia sp. R9_2]MBO9396868.1 1-acyl-sn-glycerol-3-phosphate acyltransferase [Shimia sp. R9_2]